MDHESRELWIQKANMEACTGWKLALGMFWRLKSGFLHLKPIHWLGKHDSWLHGNVYIHIRLLIHYHMRRLSLNFFFIYLFVLFGSDSAFVISQNMTLLECWPLAHFFQYPVWPPKCAIQIRCKHHKPGNGIIIWYERYVTAKQRLHNLSVSSGYRWNNPHCHTMRCRLHFTFWF